MKRVVFFIILAVGYLGRSAQAFDRLNSALYHSRVKLVSEFMQRFNGEAKNPNLDPNAIDVDKMNLCQLFDVDYILKNRQEIEPKMYQFVDSVLQNKIKIQYDDADWFAKVKCTALFKGQEVSFYMYLTVEPRGMDMYKWVITDVDGKIFELVPSRVSDKIMLLPNEHESNFMRLNSITTEKDDYITQYSSNCLTHSQLTVFNTLVYYDYLNIEYISDIEYTFLQVPGFAFTIQEHDRESTNSGWLISELLEISDADKEVILQKLYQGDYSKRLASAAENEVPKNPISVETSDAIDMVRLFVKYLNEYLNNRSSIDVINEVVKGRYTFIISDELCNQLSKYYKTKVQKSYRLDTLLNWLGKSDCPINSISISNPELFDNDNVKANYANGYTLVKCELATTGNIQIKEEVVFFIYKNQIAGVKFIMDCF